MKKNINYGFIIKQILIGISCGVFTLIIGMIFLSLFYGSFFLELFFFMMALFYFGIFAGIGIVWNEFLKSDNRHKEFLKILFQGFLGLMVGVMFLCGLIFLQLYFIDSHLLAIVVYFSIILAPLLGSIIGFNYNLYKANGDSNKL